MQNTKRKKSADLVDFELQKAQKYRLKNSELNRALYGSIAFFEDQQIRDRDGRFSSLYHSSRSDFPSKSKITAWPRFIKKNGLSLPMFLKVRNREGEWASQMHAMPKLLGNKGKTAISVQDSNMFITGFCSLSLNMISESKLPESQRIINNILNLSLSCIDNFKRGKAYNFWPQQDPVYGKTIRSGPLNIWIEITQAVAKILTLSNLHGKILQALFKNTAHKLNLPAIDWLSQCLDINKNSNGADSIFNIANDADDSSMALALKYIALNKKTPTQAMETLVKEITQYRDINRSKNKEIKTKNTFENWKGENTGAYLTWLKKESRNTFSHAQQGLIPTGKNNVDIVVNANVLFTLSLLGKTKAAGYQDCINLLCKAIDEKAWPSAGLYYPQQMMFPYVLSRAIRDGGAKDKTLLECQGKLLEDVLSLAKARTKSFGNRTEPLFYFEGGVDKSTHLSTALALITLLNLGEENAKKINQLGYFQKVIEGCINFLLKEVQYKNCKFESTQVKFSAYKRAKFIAHWEDGLFFGPVHWDLCHWRSQAVTQACVLEAFSKYLIAYEKTAYGKNTANNLYKQKPLHILSYELDKLKQGQWLAIR